MRMLDTAADTDVVAAPADALVWGLIHPGT